MPANKPAAAPANTSQHPITDAPAGLRPSQLARRWECCRQTVYNMISDGELHSFKVRNSRIIPFTEIERIERGQ